MFRDQVDKIIKASNLTRAYKGEDTALPAVRDVSLEVDAGEFVAIIGPSGCGKSTLLNLLAGIDRPDRGEVYVAGRRIDTLSETQLTLWRRRHVGIVFQFFNLIHNLNAAANIELPGLLEAKSPAAVRTRAAGLMESLGISGLADKMPGTLSGGEQQRVAIARALINSPSLLLADEPTGALDQESGQSVLRLFQRLSRQAEQTILMVTHDPKVAGYSDRIVMMRDGRLVEDFRPTGEDRGRLAAMILGVEG